MELTTNSVTITDALKYVHNIKEKQASRANKTVTKKIK
jgi:hypothetical protein